MVEYIDTHRAEFGVEPICDVLQVAPSSYYAAKSRPVSARAIRDAVMIPILVAIWRRTTASTVPTSSGKPRVVRGMRSAATRSPGS